MFPLTGVRDYALRTNEWETVKPVGATDSEFDYKTFYKTSMPAFNMLTFISSATIIEKSANNGFQVYIFRRDTRQTSPWSILTSSNSYGLTVLPMKDE